MSQNLFRINLIINIFHFFLQKNEYFLGYEDSVDIFWGPSHNWTDFRGHLYVFKGIFLR